MHTILYTKAFGKDVKRAKKQNKNLLNLKKVITSLQNEEKLSAAWKDHKLVGNYKGRRELHLEPDFLLIYRKEEQNIFLERLGSHSELFQ